MPRVPAPLPDPFSHRPFSVAGAAAAGVTRGRTRSKDLDAPFHGVRAPAGALTLQQRCVARATRLPTFAVFSHLTAARLHALPLPHTLDDNDLHVTVPTGRRAPAGRGTAGHQQRISPAEVERLHGVWVTTPSRTFCDLAAFLTVPALVAVGDHLIHHGTGSTAAEDLERAVAATADKGFKRIARTAVQMLDPASESPKESELRAIIVAAGFPTPMCQETVFDERHRFVARVDLAYRDRRIAIEYEGDHHRDKAQWRKDIARRRRLEALGWMYLSVTQADLDDPASFLSDLRAALARPHPRER